MAEFQGMRKCWGILLLSVVVGGCATGTQPTEQVRTVNAMTVTMSDTLWRRRAFEQRHGGCAAHPAVADAARIVADLSTAHANGTQVRVGILRSDIPNAYILAGGDLYVTFGMLELICSEDDMAAVLAHELSHLDDLSAFDTRGMSAEDRLRIEAEADDRAAMLLIDAGYEPAALGRMIARLVDEQPAGWAVHRCDRLSERIGHDAGELSIADAQMSVAAANY